MLYLISLKYNHPPLSDMYFAWSSSSAPESRCLKRLLVILHFLVLSCWCRKDLELSANRYSTILIVSTHTWSASCDENDLLFTLLAILESCSSFLEITVWK